MTERPHSSSLRPRLLAAAAVLLAAAVLALTAAHGSGAGSAVPRAASGDPSPSSGRQVFLRDCAWCHGTNGTGTHDGPSLTDVGAEAADFYLSTGRMPLDSPDQDVRSGPPAYDDATISALVAYVGSLGNGPGVPALASGDAVAGRKLFLENCAACHSASGTGTIVSGGQPAPELWHTAKRQVAEAVRVGPGPMPPFSDKQLDQKQVDDIVAYVHQLGSPQDRGGAGLDQYGPIIEGLVALFVLLPCLVVIIRLLGRRAPERSEQEER
ncbi:c-type cytochrome [Nocardioides sp. DS6]|uniref:C-type cytochrome n=1 Tax=Nocardioides eburneus TaxID=3231482 RepID=A0ABV3T508_9ACTN